MEIISAKALTKYYGKARGIIDVNLSVGEGDVFGFIGPNGAGKSTTIRALLGLISFTGGSASIFGKDVMTERTEILKRIGYMPSEVIFYPNMRVSQVIALSAKLRQVDCTAEADRLCKRLDIDTGKRISELSLGNRKKIGIVCAMQHRPELLIFDEPTSGLDPLMQHEFFRLLEERHDEGATVFLSSHVLSEIQRHCNRAAIIRSGKMIACDTVEALSQTAARRVVLTGVSQPPQLDGISAACETGGGVSFLYRGEMKKLITAIAALNVSDLMITEPDLEESFLHYYGKDGEPV